MKLADDGNPLDVLTGTDFEKLEMLEKCDNLDFKKCVEILALNPKEDFRFSDLSGVKIDDIDPDAYDFTGALLDAFKEESTDKKKVTEGVAVETFFGGGIQEEEVAKFLIDNGFTGFSLLPVSGGNGSSGTWSRGSTVGMNRPFMLYCVVAEGRAREIIELLTFAFGEQVGPITSRKTQFIKAWDAAREK